MIDSAFIHQVFRGFGLIGKSGDGGGGGATAARCPFGEAEGTGVLPRRPITQIPVGCGGQQDQTNVVRNSGGGVGGGVGGHRALAGKME